MKDDGQQMRSSDSQNPTIEEGIQEYCIKPPNLPKAFTLRELKAFEFPEPNPIVDNFLYRGNISLVAAKPKVGKSTLLRFLAKSVVDGVDFLDRITTSGPVLYLALEEPLPNVRRDFLAMNVVNDDKAIISCLSGVVDKMKEIESLIIQYSPVMVVVDTLIHATKIDDINDYSQTTRELGKYRELANRYNIHICLVHHSKKGEHLGNDSVLGSTGLSGAVDIIMTINTNAENERIVSSSGRSGIDFDSVCLKFDPETKSFQVGGSRKDSLKDMILNLLRNNPGIGRSDVQEILKRKAESISKALGELITEKQIENRGQGRKSSYFIVDDENCGGGE